MSLESIRRYCAAGFDEALLKAHLDGEIAESWRIEVAGHVQGCRACTERLMHLRMDGALVHGRLHLLDADAGRALAMPDARPPAGAVLARARRDSTHDDSWRGSLAAAVAGWRAALRPAMSAHPGSLLWGAAGAAALLVAAAVSQPAVQSFAQSALQSFRVQKVEPVKIDLAAIRGMPLPDFDEVLTLGTYTGPKQPAIRVLSPAEAAKATGLALRGPTKLPAHVEGGPRVWVSDPVTFSFTYDGQKLATAAREYGVQDPALLAQLQALHGRTVRGAVPAAALVLYGDPFPAGSGPSGAKGGRIPAPRLDGQKPSELRGSAPAAGPFLAFIQLKSPSLDVPQDVDVDRLREQVLRSGAVPPAIAGQLLAFANWKETLPLPITRGTATQVQVDGVTATLVTGEGPHPVLIWQKDGALYAMSTSGTEQDLLAAARSLAPVK
ncbi:MAG: hypothetical protein HY332_03835 [Chloroflexi bacterium]|nr:hypothetical protein [Chloroflexota bacterium]